MLHNTKTGDKGKWLVFSGWALLAVLMLCWAGCGAEPKEAAAPIKIGAVLDITGLAAWLGEPEANIVRMIADEVNAKGGIKGRKIELIVKDSQADGTRAKNAVTELLRENVVAIVGPSLSGTSMAVAPICEEEQVPLVSCAALEQIVLNRKWVFKTANKDTHAVERILDYMKEHGTKKIAVVSESSAFGDGGKQKLTEMAPKYGIEIVATEAYGQKDTDITPQLTKIKALNPEAIVNWSIGPAQSIIMKNAKTLGIKAQIFQSHGFGNVAYLQAAGDAAEGVIFPCGRALVVEDLPADHPQKALLAKVKKDYEAKYKKPLSTFAGHAYDALWLVLKACEEKGATRKDIRDYIENCKGFVGVTGVFNFSPEDHTGLQKDSLEMLTVRNAKFAILQAAKPAAEPAK
jgi:branched-chain amino acid transport system substrate-binding protein